MKIGLVSYGLQAGGVSTYLIRLATHLRAADHEVTVIETAPAGRWSSLLQSCPGVRSVRLPVGLPAASLYARSIARWIDAEQFDLLFMNHSKWAQLSLPMLESMPAVIPIIHSDEPEVCATAVSQAGFWDYAVAVSPKVRDRAASLLQTEAPLRLIVSGIPIPDGDRLSRRAGHAVPIRLLFVGNLFHRHKGVLHLPGIAAGCRDRGVAFDLTVIGEGPDRAALEQQFGQRNLLSKVRFRGVIDPAEVYQEMLAAHVLVHPSHCEGMPLAVLEAMACGCVPVVSRLPAITDFAIGDGVSGFLAAPGDVPGFVESIVRLALSREAWESASRAAAEQCRERFSLETCHGGFDRLIEDVACHDSARHCGARRLPVPITGRDHLRLLSYRLKGRS